MLKISRMRSLLAFSPSLCKPPAALVSRSSLRFRSQDCIFLPRSESLQDPSCLPTLSVVNSFASHSITSDSRHSRGFCTDSRASGEIHVIVGPMFAGKTTTLLKRIKSESSSGRFQANALKVSHHLDKTLKDLCYTGRVKEAVELLCCTGVQVHSEIYSLLLQECIFRAEYRRGRIIHSQMVVVGFVPDEYLKVKLLILYAKAGDLDTACVIFNILPNKSVTSWNAIISGHVQKGMSELGMSFYHWMRQCGVMPNQYTFSSVFRACSSIAILEQGKLVHSVLVKSQWSKNVFVCTALMDMYFKCSSPFDGFVVFDKSLERNVITWTALISGYGLNGRVVEVFDSFHQMIYEGFRPNHTTFLAILSACSHGGMVDEGKKYFISMIRDYGVQPKGRHYAAMVDLLGRAGRLEEAYAFVQVSPFKKHPAVWGALLGACKLHGNVEMLKIAATNFFELEPKNIGKYVVLCNAYASSGLWNNVAQIRNTMKGCGMKKERGYSMIEVQAETHFFFMGHNTHNQTEQIYVLVKEMTYFLKKSCDILELSIELD